MLDKLTGAQITWLLILAGFFVLIILGGISDMFKTWVKAKYGAVDNESPRAKLMREAKEAKDRDINY